MKMVPIYHRKPPHDNSHYIYHGPRTDGMSELVAREEREAAVEESSHNIHQESVEGSSAAQAFFFHSPSPYHGIIYPNMPQKKIGDEHLFHKPSVNLCPKKTVPN